MHVPRTGYKEAGSSGICRRARKVGMRTMSYRGSLTAVTALSVLVGVPVHAAGLGGIEVSSGLGEPFRARVPLLGENEPGFASGCARARIETLDGYLLAVPEISMQQIGARVFLNLHSASAINEPALQVQAMLRCGAAITRTYQVLLDLPTLNTQPNAGKPARVASLASPMPSQMALSDAGMALRESPSVRQGPSASKDVRTRAVSPRKAATRKQDVLRLSASETNTRVLPDPGPLKLVLSTKLSRLPTATEMAGGDASAASGLRQEAAVTPVAPQTQQMQQTLRELRADNERWRQQVATEKLAADNDRQALAFWIKLLAGALALALAGAGWLAWRGNAWPLRSRREPLLGAEDADGERRHAASGPDVARGRGAMPTLDDIAWARITEPVAAAPGEGMDMAPAIEPLADGWKPSPSVAEEVEDLLEVVEMWTRLGRADNALEVLAPYKDIEHPVSPVPWLGLLQVYAALDQRENYQMVAARLKAAFNVRTRPWEQRHEDDAPRSLGDFPHVRERIVEQWGGDALVRYLKGLIVNTRHDERQGFDIPVFRDLLRLMQLAEEAARSAGARVLAGDAHRIVNAPAGQRPAMEVVAAG